MNFALEGFFLKLETGMPRRLAFLVLMLMMLSTGHRNAFAAGARIALIIGNSAYQAGGVLRNPANDAEDIGAKLNEAGFESCRRRIMPRMEMHTPSDLCGQSKEECLN